LFHLRLKFHRFSRRTTFVSFASTSFIDFLDVRHLFHLSLYVSSDPLFWTYTICFICVYKFHRFSGRTKFVSFESTSFICLVFFTYIFFSFASKSFIVFLDVRHLFHLRLQVS